jgi:hypothetical protein
MDIRSACAVVFVVGALMVSAPERAWSQPPRDGCCRCGNCGVPDCFVAHGGPESCTAQCAGIQTTPRCEALSYQECPSGETFVECVGGNGLEGCSASCALPTLVPTVKPTPTPIPGAHNGSGGGGCSVSAAERGGGVLAVFSVFALIAVRRRGRRLAHAVLFPSPEKSRRESDPGALGAPTTKGQGGRRRTRRRGR